MEQAKRSSVRNGEKCTQDEKLMRYYFNAQLRVVKHPQFPLVPCLRLALPCWLMSPRPACKVEIIVRSMFNKHSHFHEEQDNPERIICETH